MNTIKTHILLLVWALAALVSANAQTVFLSSVGEPGSSRWEMVAGDTVQNFTAAENRKTIPLPTNLRCRIEGAPGWCEAVVADDGLRLSLRANEAAEVRTARLVLTAKDGHRAEIAVNQLGTAPAILVRPSAVTLSDRQTAFSVEVTANTPVSFALPSWVVAEDAAYVPGTKAYTFKAESLAAPSEREAELRVEDPSGVAAARVVVLRQEFRGYPRFAVISDTHFGNSMGEGPMVKVPKALRNIMSKVPLVDAIFVVGDLTDWGLASQYDQFIKVFTDESIIPASVQKYYLMGNHDNYADGANDNYAKLGQPRHQFIDIKGFPFITLSMDGGSTNDYNQETLDYLEAAMAKAAAGYPELPIFVFVHVPPYGTVYGSRDRDGGWGTARFASILEKYPQAVVFSGHSHFPLGDPRSIDQNVYTTVNDGSTTYSEIEPGLVDEGIHPQYYDNVTEGVIVTVDENTDITIERWDTYNDEEMLPRWTVKAPHDGTAFAYKGRTGGAKPAFRAGAEAVVSDVTAERCTVTFPQAEDDEVVHHYVVEVTDGNGTVFEMKKFSYFYLNSHMPLSLTVSLKGIPADEELRVSVRAVDSYDQLSEPLVSEAFTTPEYEPAPGTKKPDADLLDVVFGPDGSATDASPAAVDVAHGSTLPATRYNDMYERWGAAFTGSSAEYFKVDYSDNATLKSAFSNGFTMETLFMSRDASGCPMSGQESGGCGFELDGSILFYIRLGGSYTVLNSGISPAPGRYYHAVATYDKAAAKVKLYVNGVLCDEADNNSAFSFPSDADAQWVAIGGDAHGGSNCQFSLDGEVLAARIYGKAVSRDEVYWLYREFKDKEQQAGTAEAPKADLLDIEFTADGQAVDRSPKANAVESGSAAVTTYLHDGYGRYVATFSDNSNQYFKVDYREDEVLRSAFSNAFTFETLYSNRVVDGEVCPMSSQESGGCGFDQEGDGEITFYLSVDGSYQVLRSGIVAEPGRFYHAVFTYDKAAQTACLYVDGELAVSKTIKGSVSFSPTETAQWIAIGGDSSRSGTSVQYALDGDVVLARMYGRAVTSAEAAALFKALSAPSAE